MINRIHASQIAKTAAGALVIALGLSACGSDGGTTTATTTANGSTSATTGTKLAAATLNASGSSFQMTLEQSALAAFTQANPSITINYAGGGSAKGKQDLADKVVDFAGTDSAVKPEDLGKFKGATLLYFPIAAAPIAVTYKLGGVAKLQLSAETVAGIFQGDIAKWDDAKIKADNPGVTMPSTNITIVHRSDGSGTTSNFTKFLVAAATNWKLDKGDTITWPKNSVGAEKNTGVASAVTQTDGAIGYVDFADAKKANLAMASIKNAAGEWSLPSLEGAAAALANVKVADDLTFTAANAAGPGVYPITAPTWVLVYAKQPDKAKGEAVKAYLNFLLTDGQTLAPTVNYAALPTDLAAKAKDQLSKLQIG